MPGSVSGELSAFARVYPGIGWLSHSQSGAFLYGN